MTQEEIQAAIVAASLPVTVPMCIAEKEAIERSAGTHMPRVAAARLAQLDGRIAELKAEARELERAHDEAKSAERESALAAETPGQRITRERDAYNARKQNAKR